jgi:hypothetical protein
MGASSDVGLLRRERALRALRHWKLARPLEHGGRALLVTRPHCCWLRRGSVCRMCSVILTSHARKACPEFHLHATQTLPSNLQFRDLCQYSPGQLQHTLADIIDMLYCVRMQ